MADLSEKCLLLFINVYQTGEGISDIHKWLFLCIFSGRLDQPDIPSEEKDGKAVEKDDSIVPESRKEVNNSMPGFELISENEKKVITLSTL